ncbi:MAG: Glu/Leu/Phe/Val dehydrogenase [Thermoanaerobacteraceae bacterium]|nr:Glu/Leu/Phe/Val dehydrogenase [Thermoanaerobacteraceae bacterium]
MGIFEKMEKEGHEEIIFCQEKSTGLKSIIAIHDTTLGPALGGCRMYPYLTEEDALNDALRLSKGMTYKNAISGSNNGGAKAVIWGDPKNKTEMQFRAFGRFVGSLKGRFNTGTDVGTYPNDFVWASFEAPYFVGLPESYGGSGDTSILTAVGVMKAIEACCVEVFGSAEVKGLTVAIQGVGKVGSKLADKLIDKGAKVIVSDVSRENVNSVLEKHPDVTVVSPDEVLGVKCDILAPCALGAVLNENTVNNLKCRIICGSANNQLSDESVGDKIHEMGILYAPDFLVNAGGAIQVADELEGFNKERATHKVERIYDNLLEVFRIAKRDNIPPYKAADRFVEERIAAAAKIKTIKL